MNKIIALLTITFPLISHALETVDSNSIALPAAGGSGQVEAALNGFTGNTTENSLTTGGRIDYLANTTLMSVTGEFSKIRADHQQVVNTGWADAHYTDEFKHGLAAEAFLDYLQDDERFLANRTQAAAGVRLTLDYEPEQRALYLSLDGLHEWQSQAFNTQDYWRGNAGITYKRQISPQAHILASLRYQPKFSDWNNYNIYDVLELGVDINSALTLSAGLQHEYDSTIPAGIKHNDMVYQTALKLKF